MKLWGGRFNKETDKLVEEFNASIRFDQRLFPYDVRGSIAHARMLAACGLLDGEEEEAIVTGLEGILADGLAGRLEFSLEAEDVHLNVERLLTARIGEPAKKLHTARSRNDQVALDLRLYLKDELEQVAHLLLALMEVLVGLAEKNTQTVMPGYTHLQKAQPVTLAHHLLAYFAMAQRDLNRLGECYRRTDVLPLGAGALAGTTLPIDRQLVAQLLGFSQVAANTMDAVSDRDFAIDFCATASLIMMHLSRLSEEIILWASEEFGFVELDDAFSTGSSIMPQKKNPDVAELVRGKTGRVYGDLLGLLTTMKGLPLAYNKDLQEDKEAVFDAVDTVKACLAVMAPFINSLHFRTENLARAAQGGYLGATDVAEYLVAQGLPFREAHAVVGRLVRFCQEEGKDPTELSVAELQSFSPLLNKEALAGLDPVWAVARRRVTGGPAPSAVALFLAKARLEMEQYLQGRWKL